MILTERRRIISALGIVQILTWGTSFYLIAVLGGPIGRDTGWSTETVTAGVSIGLLVSGFSAATVGRLIQAEGGRRILAGGVLLIVAGLSVLGLARSVPIYFLAWVLLGFGMAASLYDAAFSTLGRIYGHGARSAITALTLWGGFASTVCWPISAFLVETVGWRGACFAYAGLHLAVTLPLCWFVLPRKAVPLPETHKADQPANDTHGDFGFRFWCIAATGTVLAVLVSIWSVHLITILTERGYTLAAAVGLGALIGPSQVGARVVEMLGRERHHPIWTMTASVFLVLLGFLGLLLEVPAAAALVAYGAGNGLWSIARGSVPLALFGPANYARTMGRLATPMLIAASMAPMLGAWLIGEFGARGTLLLLMLGAIVPCIATLSLALNMQRERRRLV